jgi:hypothetical protein
MKKASKPGSAKLRDLSEAAEARHESAERPSRSATEATSRRESETSDPAAQQK